MSTIELRSWSTSFVVSTALNRNLNYNKSLFTKMTRGSAPFRSTTQAPPSVRHLSQHDILCSQFMHSPTKKGSNQVLLILFVYNIEQQILPLSISIYNYSNYCKKLNILHSNIASINDNHSQARGVLNIFARMVYVAANAVF